MRDAVQASHTITDNLDIFAKLARLALDFYAVVEEFFKVGTIEDLIGGRLGVVDNELVLSSDLGGGDFGLQKGYSVSLLRRKLSKAIATDHGGRWS